MVKYLNEVFKEPVDVPIHRTAGLPPRKGWALGRPPPRDRATATRVVTTNRSRTAHATVHALVKAGHSRRAIQRQPRMTSRTVKRYAEAARPEDLFTGQWQNRTSVLDDFKPYLDDRWNEGCTNAWKLWEELVPLGYKGSYQRVRAYLHQKRTSPRPVTARPPFPRMVAGRILRRPETLGEADNSTSRPFEPTALNWMP